MKLSLEQIADMAPDAAAGAAGKKLMAPKNWSGLGHSDAALWGLCQGSAVYQVKVDLSNLGYHCSCPSRKFPCKHTLGLLMLFAESPHAVQEAATPDWVTEWLSRRQASAEKKAAKQAEAAAKPVDEKAQTRRAEQREARVQGGLQRLDLWLKDQVRAGLASLETKPLSFWDEQAKRLVDAQAPGLASRIARLAAIPGSTPEWPRRLLSEFGRLKLLLHAYDRFERLDPALQNDVRQIIGWTVSQEEIQRDGERVEDTWVVIGQWVDDEDRIRTQRSWLVGRETGRTALMLQFSAGGQPFAESIVPGSEQRGCMAFYPGAGRLRARFDQRDGEITAVHDRLPGLPGINDFLSNVADHVARQPWLTALGVALHDVTFIPHDEGWHARDVAGQTIPLSGKPCWKALAVTGGRPCDLAGEWDGYALRPLGFALEHNYWVA